jgi:hypothetical protein
LMDALRGAKHHLAIAGHFGACGPRRPRPGSAPGGRGAARACFC